MRRDEPARGRPRNPELDPALLAAALAILRNFRANLGRKDAMALVGSLLAEERRHPELLEVFRERLARPRRASLRRARAAGAAAGELPASADLDALASMLISSFYARYLLNSGPPADWAERTLQAVWPNPPAGDKETSAVGLYGRKPSTSAWCSRSAVATSGLRGPGHVRRT